MEFKSCRGKTGEEAGKNDSGLSGVFVGISAASILPLIMLGF